MLKIEGKTFMNIQEAVQWLLENNALPFQCTANYAPLTEIGLGTIVNPSPAKVRIGSLIFFADSKVSTVVGISENGFICSDQYNNLVDDVAYVTNVAINGSGHLITTMSDGQTIDAGIIKQVTSFSINASQHLIATYNDGTTSDLGAIFSGNVSISGNLTVSGTILGVKLEQIRDSSNNLRFVEDDGEPETVSGLTVSYCKWSLSGTHLMCVFAGTIANNTVIADETSLVSFNLPDYIANKIVPVWSTAIERKDVACYSDSWTKQDLPVVFSKPTSNALTIRVVSGGLTLTAERHFRMQFDLLIDND